MTNRKLDIFDLLRASDQCDFDWLSRQPEDAQKAFAPPVALRWAATVRDGPEAPYMLWMLNERVNVQLYDLYRHPDLVYRLIASCGLGVSQRHEWLPMPSPKARRNAATQLLGESHPDANEAELMILLEEYTRETFIEFIGECGVQEQNVKEVVAAYDKLFPEQKPAKVKKGKSK